MSAFLKKRQRLISFIGASIVLATFLLREVVRDHLKDLADSLDQAQSVFAIRRQIATTNERVKLLQHKLDWEKTLKNIRRIAKKGRTFEDVRSGIDDTLEVDMSVIDDLQFTQDNLERLLRKSASVSSEVTEDKAKLAQLKKESGQMDVQMQRCVADKPNNNCSEAFIEEMDKESDALDDSLDGIDLNLTLATGPILENAESVLLQRERWYGYANAASVFLFILGWLLGLLGSLFHVPDMKAEAET